MIRKVVLKNGLRILLMPHASGVAASVLILVGTGSEYEKKSMNGISHFLEHLVFKGTARRPKPGTISQELDSLGAEYNAFTGEEYTGYWAKVQRGKIQKAIDIVSDLYLSPLFNPAEIEKERGVVIEELNLYEDTPSRRVHNVFTELLYGDQPAGWDIGGRKEVIKKISRANLITYRAAHYVPKATVVAVAGHFNERAILAQLKTLFGALPRGAKGKKARIKESQSHPHVAIRFKDSDQSHLVLGVRAFPITDSRRHIVSVLGDILGGGMSSRLFRRIREELGAAYYVRAGAELLQDHGYFSISSGVDHKKINMVIAAILEEMQKLRTALVPESELRKVKDHIAGGVLLGLETADELASFYGGQEIVTGKMISPEELLKKIERVSREEVRTLAQQLFVNRSLNLAVIGPYKHAAPFARLLKL